MRKSFWIFCAALLASTSVASGMANASETLPQANVIPRGELALPKASAASTPGSVTPSGEVTTKGGSLYNTNWFVNRGPSVLNHPTCLDVDTSGAYKDGTKVQMWSCTSGYSQKWTFTAVPGKAYEFTIKQQGKCLEVNPYVTRDGAQAQIWDCNGQPWQHWYAFGAGSDIRFRNMANDGCLDAEIESYQQYNGQKVQTWWCSGSASQNWATLVA
ncbi:RICIN domain-containing protein [Streptomyces sp. NPDC001552]|uniref:RICIN domain-containing protein n=1 Tax=Streptomyces sp. NPDC001552 TaxID=3364587 RepID=UPI0036A48FB8